MASPVRSPRLRNFGPWTVEEDERLRRMAALGLPLADVAPVLGRSNDCVDVHARALGLRLPRAVEPGTRTLAQARWLAAEAGRLRAQAREQLARFAESWATLQRLRDQTASPASPGRDGGEAQPRETTGTNI